MSKLETNTIDTISGSTTLTLGGTNANAITIPSGVTLTNNGTQAGLTLSDNILFNTASKGIYLGVTSATASNLLDDYEEGTWTPSVISGSISGTSISYTGKYIKVGNILTIYFIASSASANIQVSSYVQFSGLPYSVVREGTSTVLTEDVEVTARQGFAKIGTNGRLFLGACGSSSGTNNISVSITCSTV